MEQQRVSEREQLHALVAAVLSVGLRKGIFVPHTVPMYCLHVKLTMKFKARRDGGLDAVFRCDKCSCVIATPAANIGGPLRRTKFWSRMTDETFILAIARLFQCHR